RIVDHIRRGNLKTDKIKLLILDEFDKSLEFGFKTEMEFIIGELNNLEKRFLTSATKMEQIPDFTGTQNPFELNFLQTAIPKINFNSIIPFNFTTASFYSI
ncbi:MAG: ATP-dependent helicase, partial [Spirochaetes bacterium]